MPAVNLDTRYRLLTDVAHDAKRADNEPRVSNKVKDLYLYNAGRQAYTRNLCSLSSEMKKLGIGRE